MKITLPTSDFAVLLARVIPAIPPKSTLFVLEHVLLDATNDTLEATGTDQELTITSRQTAHVEMPGKILVPARRLYDIVRALADDSLCHVSTRDSMLCIETDRGRYEIPTLSPDEYPEIGIASEAVSVTLDSNDAKLIASTVAYAASDDQYRLALTGVSIELSSTLVAVATDGYRLASIEITLGSSTQSMQTAVVPARAIELMEKLDGQVTLGLSNTHAVLRTENVTIWSRLIDEAYPQWRSVFPSDSNKHARVDRSELLRAVKRVALMTTSTSQMVRFRFTNDTVTLIARDSDTGATAEERLQCSYEGEPMEIGFNHKYITEAISHMPGSAISILLSSPSRAAIIEPGDELPYRLRSLVMPMRLN